MEWFNLLNFVVHRLKRGILVFFSIHMAILINDARDNLLRQGLR